MRRVASIAVVLTAVVLSCYGPHYGRCTIACTMDEPDQCPDGFTCSGKACVSNSEAATGSDLCPVAIDAGGGSDGGGASDGSSTMGCAWSFTVSNVDPCKTGFPPSIGAVTVDATHAIPATVSYDSFEVLHVDSLDLKVPTHVVDMPLVIISEGAVTFEAVLDADGISASVSSSCAVSQSNNSFGGGAGGGFGYAGGSGGAGSDGVRVAGGMFSGSTSTLTDLKPLTSGCPGGTGGSGAASADGGLAGGAIQVSARDKITFSGSGAVWADGAGGGGGLASGSGGGGGGASGGGILLEAPTINFGTGMPACAVGGGGGQGGNGMSPQDGAPGAAGNGCTPGMAGVNGGGGELGGGGSATVGLAGINASPPAAAGGGGGGAGVIVVRFHQSSGTLGSTPTAQVHTF